MKDMRYIGNKSIFGEYSMDENRVIAALLHIIRLCGVELVKELNINKQPHTIFKLSPGVPISIRHSEPNAFARKQRYTTIDKLIRQNILQNYDAFEGKRACGEKRCSSYLLKFEIIII